MWVDENAVMHTVWVPPEAVLGEETVAALRTVPDHVAEAAVLALNARYDEIVNGVLPDAPTGPVDFDSDDLDDMEYPTVFPGLAPQPGEPLAATVLRFLDGVPAQWRIEALEAVCDVLEPEEPEDAE